MLTYTLLAVAAELFAPARAQPLPIGVDGCTILASVVYAAVTEARLGYSAGPRGVLFYSGRNETTHCNRTARSVTGAFTAALRSANIYVTWGLRGGYSGDYCPSHFLAQCYPAGDLAMPPLGKTDRAFVMRSWRAVYDAIATRMSPYAGSDVLRFQDDELARSIRRTIAQSHSAPDRYRRTR